MNLYSKAGFAVRSAVVSPKDPFDTEEECGVIYECELDVRRIDGKIIRAEGRDTCQVYREEGLKICPQSTPGDNRTYSC